MDIFFQVVVPSFNCVDYLPRCLQSLESQGYKNYAACVINDASTLPRHGEIVDEFCQRNGWTAVHHEENTGALFSLIDGVRHLAPKDEDVIVVLDGDDWFAHENALSRLAEEFSDPDVAITWGQYEVYPKAWLPVRYAAPVPDEVIEQNTWRDQPWIFWHPHAFRYGLWRQIKDEDFRDADGEYFRISGDQAFMFPMLEMAGKHGRYIDDVLYTYNIDNPLNDFKISRPDQAETTAYIRSRPRYTPIEWILDHGKENRPS